MEMKGQKQENKTPISNGHGDKSASQVSLLYGDHTHGPLFSNDANLPRVRQLQFQNQIL